MTAGGSTTRIVLLDVLVACVFAHVHTGFASGHDHVVGRTVAPEASIQVEAGARPANVRILVALVHINAGALRVVEGITIWADAQEAAEGVGTAAVPAEVVQLGALVYVFKLNGFNIWSKSWASRTQLFVFGGVFGRADVAASAPGGTHGTAAGCLGHGCVHGGQTDASTVEVAPDVLVAQVLPGINAACPARCQAVVWRALAHVGTQRVDAGTVLTRRRTAALVDIRAVASSLV
uniref:Putative secreted protein n=1 Tax=Ixodes ricinus TaxID=34613 RepID=A0A6B0V3Q6_IXORI